MQKVFVFGKGRLYKQKEAYVKNNYIVCGFLDNEADRSGIIDDRTGLPIYHPENLTQFLENDMQIILMSYQYVPMWKQLNKLGIESDRILFGVQFPPTFDSDEILFRNGGNLMAESEGNVFYLNHNQKMKVEAHKQLQQMVQDVLREKYREKYSIINAISQMSTEPISRKFGLERGGAIDRYYIERFLEKNKDLISGDCIEIAENTYTLCYGEDRVTNSYILHVNGWGENAIEGNLETGEGILENQYDCAIITQTLMFIFDIRKVAENIYKMLKRGGNALLTVAGISQVSRYDAELWGSYYGFHEDAIRTLFEPVFGRENIMVETYGNAKTAVALLCGLCQEDLQEEDFDYNDKDYPLIVTVVLHKEEDVK